jgi:hypothetical protein
MIAAGRPQKTILSRVYINAESVSQFALNIPTGNVTAISENPHTSSYRRWMS